MNNASRCLLALLLAASAVTWGGCGGGDSDSADADSAVAVGDAAETETAAVEEEVIEESTGEESTTDSFVIQPMDVTETLTATDKAAQAQDWKTATDNLLKLQLSGSLQSDAESWQYNRRMTVLQDQLIQAADNGDANAKAAIELLRKSRRVR